MPLVHFKAKKPLSTAFPTELRTLGDHIRKVRLERKLYQKDVAKQLGVHTATIKNWEKNYTTPPISYMPKVVLFLGYNPSQTSSEITLGKQLLAYRQQHGLSIQKLAKMIPCDESTISRMEKGKDWFYEKTLMKINLFLLETKV